LKATLDVNFSRTGKKINDASKGIEIVTYKVVILLNRFNREKRDTMRGDV